MVCQPRSEYSLAWPTDREQPTDTAFDIVVAGACYRSKQVYYVDLSS
jgi:hypothetical protein